MGTTANAALVSLPQSVVAGGSTWHIDTYTTDTGAPYTGSCVFGPSGLAITEAAIPGASDAFDIAYPLFINGTHFDVGSTVDLTGTTITAGPATFSGLDVTYEMYFSASVQAARLRAVFSNPTGAPINATIDVPVNFGSDSSTVVNATSSGDLSFTTLDRWLVTSDSGPSDPVNTTVFYGPGSPAVVPSAVTSSVFNCAATNGAGATFPITVPAGQTRSLMFIAGLGALTPGTNSTGGAVIAAAQFNANSTVAPDLLSDLATQDLVETLNWDFQCGDGIVDPGEDCDDGNLANGDCCSSTCLFEAAAAPCTTDGNVCTDDACDGFGTCNHAANALPCDDGMFCTVNDACGGGVCGSAPRDCSDGAACTADTCDEMADACVNAQTPRNPAACYVAPAAKLQIKDSGTAGKDKLQWSWGKGDAFAQAALGTPEVAMGTSYTLCVYDTTATVASLEASIDIAPSTTLWESKDPKGLKYKDKAGTSEGVTKAQMKPGDASRTKVKISAGGTNLVLPAPAGSVFFNQTPNVVVQLVNSVGNCWTSEFAPGDTKINEADSFKAQTK